MFRTKHVPKKSGHPLSMVLFGEAGWDLARGERGEGSKFVALNCAMDIA